MIYIASKCDLNIINVPVPVKANNIMYEASGKYKYKYTYICFLHRVKVETSEVKCHNDKSRHM